MHAGRSKQFSNSELLFSSLCIQSATSFQFLSHLSRTVYLPCIVCFSLINNWDIPQKASWNNKKVLSKQADVG